MRYKTIALVLLLCSVQALAQDSTAVAGPWTLRQCIDYALEHNISIKQSSINVRQKEIALNTAEARRLPGISASGTQNFSFGRGLTADNTYSNTNTTSTSFSLGGDIPIFHGFDINNGIKLSKLDLQAATTDLQKAKDDIKVAVAQAYTQVLYSREILSVASNQVRIDSLQHERLKLMYKTGKASTSDVAAQAASLAQSKLSETQALGNERIALLDLSQLLELASPEGFDICTPPEEILGLRLLLKPEDIYAEAVEERPAIISEQLRLDYANVDIARAKGGLLPSLSLSGGIGTNFYTANGTQSASFGEQLKNNFSQYIGLSLNIPIFARFSTRNSIRSAQLAYDHQKLQLENTKKSLYKEIQQAYYNAVTSQSRYTSSEQAAISAEQSFNLIRERYENGKANITEYNEAKNRYLEAASNFLQARYECLFQTKLLDFYRTGNIDLQ